MRLRALLVVLVVSFLAASASAGDLRIIVTFKGQPDAGLLAKHGARAGDRIGGLRALRATASGPVIAKLRADPAVALVEEDGIAEALGKGNKGGGGKPGGSTSQPAQATPWGVARVHAPLAGNTGAGIKVAIIDTGIDLDHPDLVVREKVDYTGSRKGADDENGHGTHVAGTVAALNNAIGVVGCAPDAYLCAVRTLDRRGSGWLSDVAAGIDWTATHGVQVANMSLGGSSSASVLRDACDNAAAAGVLLIAAAGNSGDGSLATDETSYPAAYDSVVAVGATDSGDGLASFSNSGSYLEMSAPGVSVPSTYKGGGYATLSGTSMASPHVTGVAALIWKELGSPSAATVRAELHTRIRDFGAIGRDKGYGFGIVDYAK